MEYSSSAEVDLAAYRAFNRACRLVDPILDAKFAEASLSTFNAKLRYVPIVMPEAARVDYPDRSKLLKKQRIYDCAPQLNYEVFISGTLEDQLGEYLRGIAESSPYLVELGATPKQVEEFECIMGSTATRILEGNAEIEVGNRQIDEFLNYFDKLDPQTTGLGGDPEQVKEFKQILANANPQNLKKK